MPHPLQARNAELRAELQRLQADNAVLAHRVAREREKARESGREGTASSSWLTPLAWLLTRNICILCSQARDSERDRARLETELELETERAFNLGSGSQSRCSSYPPSPALSSTSGTPAMISPRLLTLPYSPGLRREYSSDAPSGARLALGRGTSESSLSGAESVSVSAVSRPDSAGGTSNPATPGRAPREPSPHSAAKPKQTGS